MENIYSDEAKERWGHTDAYKESANRTKNFSKEDWAKASADQERAVQLFIDAMDAGKPVDSSEASAAAMAHRKAISDWFYECSREIHIGLAQMYIADSRFTKFYEDRKPGLAKYVHDAILATKN